MRIAVISLKVNANYGGLLQAWAMQEILTRMGHEAVLIDSPDPRDLSLVGKLVKYPQRAVKKYLFGADKPIRHEKLSVAAWHKAMAGVSDFVSGRIRRREVKSVSEIGESEYDMILYGSDQVWRPEYCRYHLGDMRNAFGWFARGWHGVKVASYAASFGIDSLDEFTSDELKDIAMMLKRFSGVSVREKSGVKLCEQMGVKATHVLDPTMLLDRDDYLALLDNADVEHRQGVMTYILDSDPMKDELVSRVAELNRSGTFSVLAKDGEEAMSVEQWIAGFRDADVVVTDSFHACVFSIIFGKPFIVADNPQRGSSRIDSLLAMFGLNHHKVGNPSEICSLSIFAMDQEKTDGILGNHRARSMSFLAGITQ